jgi:hypothetical protein
MACAPSVTVRSAICCSMSAPKLVHASDGLAEAAGAAPPSADDPSGAAESDEMVFARVRASKTAGMARLAPLTPLTLASSPPRRFISRTMSSACSSSAQVKAPRSRLDSPARLSPSRSVPPIGVRRNGV